MPCYPSKNTSEPFITTIGSKPCTFQIQMKFGQIHQILFFSFSFFLFSLQTQPGDILAGYPLSLSPILLVLSTWTQRKGGARGNLAKITPLSSLSP
jgi:hypothetical protein